MRLKVEWSKEELFADLSSHSDFDFLVRLTRIGLDQLLRVVIHDDFDPFDPKFARLPQLEQASPWISVRPQLRAVLAVALDFFVVRSDAHQGLQRSNP